MVSLAPGSVKLFGEHAVIYDRVGLSASFDRFASANIREGEGQHVELMLSDLKLNRIIDEDEINDVRRSLDYLLDRGKLKTLAEAREGKVELPFIYILGRVFLKVGFRPLQIKITSTIPRASGLGSSAAVFSSFANELCHFLKLKLPKEELAQLANLGDKIIHGNPSGIDVATCTFGGYIRFRKSEGAKPFTVDNRISLLIVDSGVKKDTGKMVAEVRKRILKDSVGMAEMFDMVQEAAFAGMDAIKENNLIKLGAEFDRAQIFFRKVGLTTKETDEIIRMAKRRGAYGAKITGAGGGGCVIIVAEKPSKLLPVFDRAGYPSFRTILGVNGVEHKPLLQV